MPEQETTKNVFDLRGGLNTELNEISWPDGFTTDEANYELLSDGTRRRRKGLASEASAGAAHTISTLVGTEACQQYVWKNVGGDPTKAFTVHQIGQYLFFTNDDTNPSASWHSDEIDLLPHGAETTPTVANVRDNMVRFSQGRGHLFVTGPFLKPFYVNYNATTDLFEDNPISVQYRDFEGIDDGVDMTTRPIDASIPADHRYNLRNRGWKDADYIAVEAAGVGTWPSKNSLWYSLYKRAEGTGTNYDPEGAREVSVTKYDAEVWGQSSAPQGALFLDPFDTRFAASVAGADAPQPITACVNTDPLHYVLTLTVVGHGFSGGENVTISGTKTKYEKGGPRGAHDKFDNHDGTWPVSNVVGNNFDITVDPYPGWVQWVDLTIKYGEVSGTEALANSEGSLVQKGFKAIAFHAGRMWYAGLQDSQFADHLFFSRICEKPASYGECFQRQDPTDETFNDITPADGGVLIIPGLAGVTDAMSIGNSLVLTGTEGAWEVSGVRGAVFTALAFGVRQITDANLNSPTGTIVAEDAGVAVGPSGIYRIAPNEFTRLLEATNITEETIQTKWNQYTTSQQEYCQLQYDDAKKRLYFLMGADSTSSAYNELLILHARFGSWTPYTFAPTAPFALLSMWATTDADDSSSNQKMKFLYEVTTTTVQVADFEQTDFLDFDGNESPLPYMVTGYDNLNDFQRRKQAPIITAIQRRTETGYTANGQGGWDADNESSTFMTPLWDWTEQKEWDVPTAPTAQQTWSGTASNYGVSGKIGKKQQVYRHGRRFVPLAAGDVDGYPVVVTRNKVRGRGRVLQLRFDGAATKDSHLIGWTTNYKITRKK
jgi:hypothetical protein